MDFVSMEKLKKYAFDESFNNDFYGQLSMALETIQETGLLKNVLENEHILYPKYLWHEDRNIDLYFLTKSKIYKCEYGDRGVINLSVRSIEAITKIELLNIDLNAKTCELIITMNDGEKIAFSSDDSNKEWKNKYYKAIMEIYNRL